MAIFSKTETGGALFQLAAALRERGYSFTTVTPLTHERVNARKGNEWAQNERDVFGWSRPFRSETLAPELFELMQCAEILEQHDEGWNSKLRLSSLDGQLFWHSAFPTNEADAVFFGPDTYRYAEALRELFGSDLGQVKRAADVGTGSGVGAILMALAFPEAEVFGLDINPRALELTRVNARLANANNVEARESNLLRDVDGQFDLIISNPPYLVDANERAYRHGGGPLGAGLSLAIVEAAVERLTPTGTLLLYTGAAMMNGRDPFREEVEKRLPQNAQWSYREMDVDVFGEELETQAYGECDRIAAVVVLYQQD